MHDWIIPGAAVAGVLGQLWISAKRSGADEQRLKAHGARILVLEVADKEHERRISHVEGRLGVQGN